MKNICITYKMRAGDEVSESCVTLPMTEARAESILTLGEDSAFVSPHVQGSVYRVLANMAICQGYDYDGFCGAELV